MSYYNRGTEKDDDPEPMFAWVGEYLDDEEKSPPRRNKKYSPDYTGSTYSKAIEKSKYYISDPKCKFEKERLPLPEKSRRSADYGRYSPERGDVSDKKYYAEKEKYLLEKSKLLEAKGRYLDMVESEKKYGSNGNSVSSDYRYSSPTTLGGASSKSDGPIRIDYGHGQKRSHEDDRMFQQNNNRSLSDTKYSSERRESLYPKRSEFGPLNALDMVRKTEPLAYKPDDEKSRHLRSLRESSPLKQSSFKYKPESDRYKADPDSYKLESTSYKPEFDRHNPESDRYKPDYDRYKLESDRYKSESDRYKEELDSYKLKSTSYKSEFDRHKPESDRYKPDYDRYKLESDRYKSESDRYKPESNRYKAEPDSYRSDFDSQYKNDIGRYKTQHDDDDDYGRLNKQDVRKRSLSPMDNRFSKERYSRMDERDQRELNDKFNELAKNEKSFKDDGYSSRYGQSPDDDRPSYSTYTSSATDDVLRDRYACLRKETRETKYKGDEKYSPFEDLEMEIESPKEKYVEKNEKSRSAGMNFHARGDDQFEREGSRSSRSRFDDRRFKDTFKESSLPHENLPRRDNYEPPAKLRDNTYLGRSRSPYDQRERSSPAISYPMSFNDKRVVMSKNDEHSSNISKPPIFDRSTFDPEDWENKVSTESPKNRVVIRRDKLEESIDNLDSSHYQKLLRRNIVDDAIKKSVDWLTDYEIWYEKLIKPLLSASNIHCKDPFEFLMCLSRGEKWTYVYIPIFNQGGKDLLRFLELYKINIMQQPVDDNDFMEIKSKIFIVKTAPQVMPKFNQQTVQQTIRNGNENYINFAVHRNFQNKNSTENNTTDLQMPQQRTIRKFSDKKEDSLKVNIANKKSKVKPVCFGWNLKKDNTGAISKSEIADNEEEYPHDASQQTPLQPPTVIKKRAPSMMKPPSPLFPKKKSKSPERSPKSRSRSPGRSTGHTSKSPRRSARSPRRKSRSPRRRSISPRRRSGSPQRRSGSPRRRSISARRKSRSPRRTSISPRRRSRSPRRRSISPRRRSSPLRRSRSPLKKLVSTNTRIGNSNSRRRPISPSRRSISPLRRPRRSISPRRRPRSPQRRSRSPRGCGRQGFRRSPRRRSRSPLVKQPTPPGTSRNSSPLSPIRQPAPPGIRRYSRTRPPTPPSLKNKLPKRRDQPNNALDAVSTGKNKSPPRRVIAKTPEKEENENVDENSTNDNIKCVISNTKTEQESADGIWTTEEMEAEAKAEGNKMKAKEHDLPLKEDHQEEKLLKQAESIEKDKHQMNLQKTIIQDNLEDNIPQRYKRFGLKPPLGPRIYASVQAPVYSRKQDVTLPLLQYHVEKAVKDSLNILYTFGKYTKNKVDNVGKTAITNFERLHGSSTWYSIDHVCYEISQVLENKNKETLEQHSEIITKEHGDISKVHENSRFMFLKYRTLVFHLCKKQLRPSKSYHHPTSVLDAIENTADLTYPVFCGIAPVIIKLWNWREIMSSGYDQYVKSHPDPSFSAVGYSKENIPLYMNNIFRMPPFEVAEIVSYRNVRQLLIIMGLETTLDDVLKRIIKWWCCGYYQLKQLNDQGKMAKIEMLKQTEASEKLVILDEVYSEDEEDQQRMKELETAPTIDLF